MDLNDIHDEGEKASVSLKIVLLIFALVVVGALAYMVYASQSISYDNGEVTIKVHKSTATTTATPNATATALATATLGWKTWTNATYHYSLKYPTSYAVNSLAADTDADTTIRENASDGFWTYNIKVTANSSNKTLAQVMSDTSAFIVTQEKDLGSTKQPTVSDIKVAGKDAKKFLTGTYHGSDGAVFLIGTNIVTIWADSTSPLDAFLSGFTTTL